MRCTKKSKLKGLKYCLFCLSLCLILLLGLCSCGNTSGKDSVPKSESLQKTQESDSDAFEIEKLIGTASGYSEENNWLNIPTITKPADTIYLYPTCNMDNSEDAEPICGVDDAMMRAGAQRVYESQATVFEEATNVFAPYYRQSNIYYVGGMTNAELEKFQMNEQRTDVYAALDYYFAHYNDGRPFIIAGHSQGSIMVKIVLGEYMQAHPEYQERMIAAYPIGYSITSDWLEAHPYLKFAEEAGDTGVIVSWNTEGAGNKDQNNLVVEKNAISINPINWKRDETPADYSENLGSRILNEETGEFEIRKNVADATLNTERGVVICNSEEPFVSAPDLFGTESYHNGDYTFYYENLKQNAVLRVQNYMEQQK